MHRPARIRSWLLGVAVLSGCGASPESPASSGLENSAGKEDGVGLTVRLSASNPDTELEIFCDASEGCVGHVDVELLSPDACSTLGSKACDPVVPSAARRELAILSLESVTEGFRELPLVVETQDGNFVRHATSMAFSVESFERVTIGLRHIEGSPELRVSVRAQWDDRRGDGSRELEAYLDEQPGLTYSEISTQYEGVRAYELRYEQPIEHGDPSAGTFVQAAVLHHRDPSSPMVLYHTGYALNGDYQCELADALEANQIDVEHRYFGGSKPEPFGPESWKHLTMRNAADDDHRFVELLRPFYDGPWLSTGHSKGGSTAVIHRRFHPRDVELTVAYVAPTVEGVMSDSRYPQFLDQIGSEACREAVRDVQRALIERLDDLEASVGFLDISVDEADYAISGGLRAAFEDQIELFEWTFWQYSGASDCASVAGWGEEIRHASDAELSRLVPQWTLPMDDETLRGITGAYQYQGALEKGLAPQVSVHLEDVEDPGVPLRLPEGTMPEYNPETMRDVRQWVSQTREPLVFIYGEFDPWTAGAFEVSDGTPLVIVPRANHSAMIYDLDESARDEVLDAIGRAITVRPDIHPSWRPSAAPRPALERR